MTAHKPNIAIRSFENPDASVIKAIDDLLISFNEKALAIKRDAMVVAAYDKEEFIGGIYFRWYGPSAIIEHMAINEKWRRQGVGKRLLIAAEREIHRQGCRWITVNSMSFQAPEFYRRLGYEVIATVPQFFENHDHLILRKMLPERPVSNE